MECSLERFKPVAGLMRGGYGLNGAYSHWVLGILTVTKAPFISGGLILGKL
jgi:hypothetical protein